MTEGLTIEQKAMRIAEDLEGTCSSLHEALERHGWDGLENNTEFCQFLDERILECVQCSWWSEACELNEEGVCEDCQ